MERWSGGGHCDSRLSAEDSGALLAGASASLAFVLVFAVVAVSD
jgi:hypothetical protein